MVGWGTEGDCHSLSTFLSTPAELRVDERGVGLAQTGARCAGRRQGDGGKGAAGGGVGSSAGGGCRVEGWGAVGKGGGVVGYKYG